MGAGRSRTQIGRAALSPPVDSSERLSKAVLLMGQTSCIVDGGGCYGYPENVRRGSRRSFDRSLRGASGQRVQLMACASHRPAG
jgi:hypothetical protein